jgi:hypothetical protein
MLNEARWTLTLESTMHVLATILATLLPGTFIIIWQKKGLAIIKGYKFIGPVCPLKI